MGFDQEFFDELRSLTDTAIASVDPQRYRPSVSELLERKIVSRKFVITTTDFVKNLYTTKSSYKFDAEFRVFPQHIANWSAKKSFRKQLNVGFYAGNDPTQDTARIGLGFRLNHNENEKGIDEYLEFLRMLQTDPTRFDQLMSRMGNYSEGVNPPVTSNRILSDNPNYNDDWRFYGKVLHRATDLQVLSSTNLFVDEAVTVFDAITAAGFY